MTNYIINPEVFYWINVLSILQTVFGIIGAMSLIGFGTLFFLFIWKKDGSHEPKKSEDYDRSEYEQRRYKNELESYHEEVEDINRIRKYMFLALIAGSIFVLISIFIPSKQTSIEMLVARTATFDNVDWTVQQVKEVIDYIVSALKGAM